MKTNKGPDRNLSDLEFGENSCRSFLSNVTECCKYFFKAALAHTKMEGSNNGLTDTVG